MIKEKTICAQATAPGDAGIAIIRISGQDALKILKTVFRKKTDEFEPRHMYLGDVVSKREAFDRALAVYFAAPHSYTGEDVCEIHTHGGAMAARLTIDALLSAGASLAEPGEFSKRAFLNGKMDVSQAEAVQDLIGALTEGGARASASQMRGALKQKIRSLQDRLTDCIAAIEAGIEYPEEDLEETLAEAQKDELAAVRDEIAELIKSYDKGKLLKEGAKIAIAGLPNVGKSSLLNRILGEERAIVTKIAGTTRDVIAEYFNLNGIPVQFVDTAGIRQTQDEVEKIGVEKSYDAISSSALVLMLFDAARSISKEDLEVLKDISKAGVPVKVLLNKTDEEEPSVTCADEVYRQTGFHPLEISAKSGKNIDALLNSIYSQISLDKSAMEGTVIVSLRHKNSLVCALRSLTDAIEQIGQGVDLDCMSIDLRASWDSLGEITGETLTEDIIDRIFTKFCLGK